MKKHSIAYLFLLLTFSVGMPCMAQNSTIDRVRKSTIERLDTIKSHLDKEVDELKKCVKRDQNCDSLRTKIYLTVATIGSVLLAATTGTAIYLLAKDKKKRSSIPLLGPRESVTKPIRRSHYYSLAPDFF